MIKNFIKAARLRTLPLSVSGIIVGSLLGASHVGTVNILTSSIFWLAILTTIGFQIISNFANDYGDGVKGADANRTGEARMVATGAITPSQMKTAIWAVVILILFVALTLIYIAFGKENFGYSILFFFLGIASIIAAIKYTVGKKAYGYSGLGDLFVFLFFGLLSVLGSYFLYTKSFNFQMILPAISVGLLSTAVLNLNNMRDYEQDKKNQKNTLVVKMGIPKAKIYHASLFVIALSTALIFLLLNFSSWYQLVFLIAFIPLIINALKVLNTTEMVALDGELKKVALSTFVFGILFGLSFYINF